MSTGKNNAGDTNYNAKPAQMQGAAASRSGAQYIGDQRSSTRRGDDSGRMGKGNHRSPSGTRATEAHLSGSSLGDELSRPALPVDADPGELDQEVRKELSTLPKGLADLVGSHLVVAARVLDENPQLALAHTRFARSKAGRVAAVREAAGLAAYVAGEWSEALAELRAARRLGGDPGRLAVLADCERALGRPERALEIARSPEAGQLGVDETIELRIVAAGATWQPSASAALASSGSACSSTDVMRAGSTSCSSQSVTPGRYVGWTLPSVCDGLFARKSPTSCAGAR